MSKIFTGSELAAFLGGEQRWPPASGAKTGPGFGGHTHDLDTVIFLVSTRFLFDPPDADLFGTSFQVVDVDGPLNAKDRKRFDVDYTIANQGPGPAPRFRVGFYISEDVGQPRTATCRG
jgi:hypothetical protein